MGTPICLRSPSYLPGGSTTPGASSTGSLTVSLTDALRTCCDIVGLRQGENQDGWKDDLSIRPPFAPAFAFGRGKSYASPHVAFASEACGLHRALAPPTSPRAAPAGWIAAVQQRTT